MGAFERVSARKKCPVCGAKDWCLVASDGNAAICPRTEQGSSKYIDGSGYLHVFAKSKYEPGKEAEWREAVQTYRSDLPLHNSVKADMMKSLMLKKGDKMLKSISENLEISEETWLKMWVGYSSTKRGYCFPMFRKGYQLVGIRVRQSAGKKFAFKGSREGLFIPKGFDSDKRPVVVCEGPTDTAVCVEFDFRAVGRPSCLGGQKLLAELLENEHVCILADSDGPGQTGAQKLAEALAGKSKSVSVATPPAKDLREWMYQGCQRQDLLNLIRGAATSLGTT
tara:strand:+ start:2813 stop:3655 length:843 start_codon:yes stop_codon:yes gene_type:complete